MFDLYSNNPILFALTFGFVVLFVLPIGVYFLGDIFITLRDFHDKYFVEASKEIEKWKIEVSKEMEKRKNNLKKK